MEKRSDPKIVQTVTCGSYLFAWEDYWTEDDAGFCSVEFVWEKHTRLKVFSRETGELVKLYDFDSRQDEKSLSTNDSLVIVTYQLNVFEKVRIGLDSDTLEISFREKI